ncbi:MAG: NADH-ubiquinone oxidoreductase-F iron-sulfur binding region domain-containing protein [Solirubrobacteraceae bacterium]
MSAPARAPSREASLPRLLAGVSSGRPMSFDEHVDVHGRLPALRGDRQAGRALIEELRRAGLAGRGGAGFPTAMKLEAVARQRGRPVVVVNGAEGEPASRKDRVLLRSLPHLVLDGGVLAAEALGADEAIVCASAREDLGLVANAIAERPYSGRGASRVRIRLELVPHAFVSGEETALIQGLSGRRALPSFTPPRPFERGVQGRPTLVNNTETIAHVAMIARGGADWFRALGTEREPGSALVTLSGPVAHPGVYEIERGVELDSLLDVAGGLTGSLRAALFGGYGGAWIGAESLGELRLCAEDLGAHGASFGAGVIALLDAEACPVAELVRLVRWLAGQTAGQCGPCVHGLGAIASTLANVARGAGARSGGEEDLRRLMSLTHYRGACRHPDGVVQMLDSALYVFADELADHAANGPCDACVAPPRLPLPSRATQPRELKSSKVIA